MDQAFIEKVTFIYVNFAIVILKSKFLQKDSFKNYIKKIKKKLGECVI